MRLRKKHLQGLVNVFMPKHRLEAVNEVRKHVVVFLLYSMAVFILCGFFGPFLYFVPKNTQTALMVGALGLLSSLTVIIYKHTGFYRLAANWMVGSTFTLLSAVIVFSTFYKGHLLFWLVLPPTIAGVFLSSRNALLWSFSSIGFTVYFFFSDMKFAPSELAYGSDKIEIVHFASVIGVLAGSFMFVLMFKRVIEREIRQRKLAQTELHIAKVHAEEASQLKSKFMSYISEEIRPHMHGVLSYSKFGLDKYDKVKPEKVKGYFRNVNESAKKMVSLLDMLIEYSQFESDNADYSIKLENIQDVTKKVVDEMSSVAVHNNISIELNIGDAPTEAWFDHFKVAQVLRSLLFNAMKSSSDNTKIEVLHSKGMIKTGKIIGGGVKVSVLDHGDTLSELELKQIFDPYKSDCSENETTGGIELGLSVSKKIITAHGGDIWAEANPDGKGSVFNFTLPIERKS